MNFTSLQYFLTTAEELNITHAAARLYISQQALSGQISKLERELGVTLFNRVPVFSLTYAGRELVRYATQIVNVERQIYQTAGDINHNQRGELRLGISYTCGRAILPSILPAYRSTHPLIKVSLLEGNSTELEDSLQRGELDLMIGFTPIQAEGIRAVKLVEERLFLVVPKAMLSSSFGACYHSIKSECERNLALDLFGRLPFILLKRGNRIRTLVDQYMRKVGFVPNLILETENTETAFALARQGMAVTIYPELFRWCIPQAEVGEEPVEFFPLQDRDTTGTLVIAWMETYYQTRAAAEFVDLTRRAIAGIRERQKLTDDTLL